MSVIYHGYEPHGSCLPGRADGTTVGSPGVGIPATTNECGGEELWAFVPFDQLSKLGERVKPQARSPHTYVVATPIRVTDIFVPGDFSPTAGAASPAPAPACGGR